MAQRMIRLGSSSVLFTAHATVDSRYVLLPIIESSSKIIGWRLYDSQEGQLLTDGPANGVWPILHEARSYVQRLTQ